MFPKVEVYMLIRNWMTSSVISVKEDASMLKVSKLMKEHGIKRVPVVDDENKLIGIVSDRDIKEASPSKATTLDIHELSYLLSELKIKDIMTKDPVAVSPMDTIEQVALIMLEKKLTGLPVVDWEHKLVGIITEADIFKIFTEISGVKLGGIQFALELSEEPGTLPPVLDLIRENGGRLISVLTGGYKNEGTMRDVYIRIRPMGEEEEKNLIEKVKANCKVVYWADDKVHLV